MSEQRDLPERVARAAAGDVDAQGELMVAFTPLARATARRLVDDPAVVDDVVQEAFLEVFAALRRLRHGEAFPAWVRLAVRKHAQRHRRSARPIETLSAESDVGAYAEDELIEQRELSQHVRSVLITLRRDDRRLLELRYLAEWSITELAEALGISQGAVRKRLHDARRRARPHLNRLTTQEKPMSDYEQHLGRLHRSGDLAFDLSAPEVARPDRREPIATGLKILDAIAPIARGGTVELVGPAGTGHLVLVLELSYRLNRSESESAIVAVASTQSSGGARSNLSKLVTEVDEHDRHAVIEWDGADVRQAMSEGRALARGLAAAGLDVLLVVDRATVNALGSTVELKAGAGLSPGGGSVTAILLDAYERGLDLPTDAGMDTRLVFSLEQVALGIYPALDPEASRAHFHDPDIADDVRRLLAQSTEIRQYFNQPMYVATDYTGIPATWVDGEDTESELRRLLDVGR